MAVPVILQAGFVGGVMVLVRLPGVPGVGMTVISAAVAMGMAVLVPMLVAVGMGVGVTVGDVAVVVGMGMDMGVGVVVAVPVFVAVMVGSVVAAMHVTPPGPPDGGRGSAPPTPAS